MNAQKPPAHRQFDDNEEEWPEPDPEELRQLLKQVAELRAKGIISGGDGPRDSLKPTAQVPGALARLLADGR